jgi:Carboxypeptidase regulatory-like domain/TonB dependent receptor
MRISTKLLAVNVVLSCLYIQMASAQIGGGSIIGSVVDTSDAAIAGAKVKVTNAATNVAEETTTNITGYFEFPLLPAGRYVLEARAPGFQTGQTEEFALNTGTRPRFDLKLSVGQASESVKVEAVAPIVNTTTTDLGVVISNAEVEALPLNGRDFQQLVGLQPGSQASPVTAVGSRGGMEFNGASAWGNSLLLDGVDMTFGENPSSASDKAAGTEIGGAAGSAGSNGLGRGSLINTISIEAIQEFKTTSSAFSAEYGRATGGVLNITTKSGTNQFHGTLFEFFRNDKLDANSFFSNFNGFPKPALRLNQYGANLGGPIKRDKVFFFFNYEGAQAIQGETVSGTVPTPFLLQEIANPALRQNLELLPPSTQATSDPRVGLNFHTDSRTNDENTYVSRGDIDLGTHRLALRYDYNHQNFQKPNLIETSPSIFPTRFHNAAIQDTDIISPSMVNELRLGFNRTDLIRHDTQVRQVPAFAFEFSSGINTGMDQLHFTGNTFTVANNFTLIHGRHTFKTGFEFRDVQTYRDEYLPEFQFYFTLDDLVADHTDLLGEFFGVAKHLHDNNFGIFFQDDWRVSKRLQVNAGLRWEYFTPFRGGYNVDTSDPFGPFGKKGQDMYRPYHNDFGPRLGLVFDVLGNQKLVVRAGGALMYTPPVMQLNYDVSFADPRLPFFAMFLPADLPPGSNLSFPFPTSFFDPYVANPSSLPADIITGRNIIDYNHRDEKAGQWNLSVQYAVRPNLALQISYVGTRGLNLFSNRDLNLFDPNLGARPVAGLADVIIKEYAGRSSYHAMQFSANQRLYHGLNLNFYYTYAKALSYYGADGNIGADLSVQDPNNIRASYGPKNSDLRHLETIVASYSLPTPGFVGNSALRKAFFAGWVMEGIESAHSGEPINVFAGVDLVGNQNPNNGDRPDLVPGVNQYIRGQKSTLGVGWLNPAAFDINAPLAAHRFGNLGYNTERGPSALTFDFALHKMFYITERQTVTFRVEAFNVLNRVVFNLPVNTRSSPTFGIIQGGSDGRNVQLALKYRF